MSSPSATPVVAASMALATPKTQTPTVTMQHKSSDDMKQKCIIFLANLLDLSRKDPKSVERNVRNLIQELIDAQVEPEEFCNGVEQLLKASSEPFIIGFVEKCLPLLRQSLVTKNVVMEGINLPVPHTALSNVPAPLQPTPVTSNIQIHPGVAAVSTAVAVPRRMSSPSVSPVVAPATTTQAPTDNMQKPMENTKEKCRNFLANLLDLSRKEPKPVEANVRNVIQELIDARVEPEEFCDRLERLLNASPQPCLLGFLKKNLPPLRQSLVTKELVIAGINPPASHVAFSSSPAPVQPSLVSSNIQIKSEIVVDEPETMSWANTDRQNIIDENSVIKEEEDTQSERQPEQMKNGSQGGEGAGTAVKQVGLESTTKSMNGAAATLGNKTQTNTNTPNLGDTNTHTPNLGDTNTHTPNLGDTNIHTPNLGDMRNQKRRGSDAVSPATAAIGKKIKLSNSVGVSATASREADVEETYNNAATAHLRVVVFQSDDIEMDEMQADILRQELESLSFARFVNHKDDNPLWMPRFKEFPCLASGGLRITCQNDQSLDWLKSQVDQLKGVWEGCPGFYVMQESLIHTYTRGKIWVPDFSEGDVGVLRDYLAAMNREDFDINTWPLLTSKTEKDGWTQNITLVVGIPPADLLKLKEGDCCLYYKLATVNVSLCENKNDQARGLAQEERRDSGATVVSQPPAAPIGNREATTTDKPRLDNKT